MGSLRRGITGKERRMLVRMMDENLAEGKAFSSLKNKLRQVALLCRLFNKKVEITYETEGSELKTIATRVWLTTCKSVVLKEGVSIPTSAIKEVKVM